MTYRLGRRPVLDGLRAIAVLLVMAEHAKVPGFHSAGVVGVTLFFVLSGFLITQLLTEERERAGRIDLRAFYLRRVRRLLPALVLFVGVVGTASVARGGPIGQPLAAITYTSNIVATHYDMGMLAHTWSLSMEEQFYLLWPLALVWAGRRWPRRLAIGLVATVVAVVAYRVVLMLTDGSPATTGFSPLARGDALLIGCLLALAMQRVAARHRLGWWAIGGTVVLVATDLLPANLGPALLVPITLAAAAVVAWGSTTARGGVLQSRTLVGVGRVSYGLYLWHYPVVLMLLANGVPWAVAFPATVAVSLALAGLSWRLVEEPILRKRTHVPAPVLARV